ncbi:MAG: 50S ribosomal protein L30e [Candidatus Aenigmarchaeota archaeon]|nr:50S ribosomal protein L30e [Candidatus Aenigmarchaeota archaeon]
MDLSKIILEALKSNNVIIGYKKSIAFLKLNKPKLIVIANNAPERIRKEIEYNAKIAGVRVEITDSNSKELGVLCGKPFPVTTLVIK